MVFIAALLLLFAAGHSLWMYFTHWGIGDESGPWWRLALGIVYLLIGAALVYFTFRRAARPANQIDRYVRIKDNILTYKLDQVSPERHIDLSQVKSALRTNARDLKMEMQNGTTEVLPIYLVADEEKQKELEKILLGL